MNVVDLMLEKEMQMRPKGLKFLKKICQSLKQHKFEVQTTSDVYWGLKFRIGDRIATFDMICYDDVINDTKRSNKNVENQCFQVNLPMTFIEELIQGHYPQSDKAIDQITYKFRQLLTKQFKEWRNKKSRSKV